MTAPSRNVPIPARSMEGLRVLVVDDDQFLAESVADILSEEAAEVEIARTGAEAFAAVQEKPYGIALIDVRLPDMDGVDLMRRLREAAPDLDIVIITRNASVHSAIAALNHGASRYLLKPCAPDELLSVVRDLFDRQLLHERNRLYLRRLEVQNSLSEAISSALLPEEAAMAAVTAIRSLAEAQVAVVLTPVEGEPGQLRLHPLAYSGMEAAAAGALAGRKEVRDFMVHGARGVPGMVVLDEGIGARPRGEFCPLSLYRLRGRGGDLGVLAVAQSCELSMDEHHDELMAAIANWVGVALERAMLYRRLELAYSELKTAHRRLIQAEKHSAIGRLAAGLAHEVGTPLNIISGRAEFLLEEVDPASRPAKGLKVILDQIERISRLIRQLLDFAREYSPARERIDLSGVLAAVLPLLEGPLSKNKIDIDVHCPDTLPKVTADFNQMQQVFVNLIMNSIDAIATDPGHGKEKGRGSIVVGAEYVPRLRKVVVNVVDNGGGIREEHQDKVFEPFFSTKDVGSGTGLGLAVVYGIVTEHGGSIEVESVWTRGTTVRFTLPTEGGYE